MAVSDPRWSLSVRYRDTQNETKTRTLSGVNVDKRVLSPDSSDETGYSDEDLDGFGRLYTSTASGNFEQTNLTAQFELT